MQKTITEKLSAETLNAIGKFALWKTVGGEFEHVLTLRKFSRKIKMQQKKR
jgi:hypothetical protein